MLYLSVSPAWECPYNTTRKTRDRAQTTEGQQPTGVARLSIDEQNQTGGNDEQERQWKESRVDRLAICQMGAID